MFGLAVGGARVLEDEVGHGCRIVEHRHVPDALKGVDFGRSVLVSPYRPGPVKDAVLLRPNDRCRDARIGDWLEVTCGRHPDGEIECLAGCEIANECRGRRSRCCSAVLRNGMKDRSS